jgi:2-haloacid dehalogenase
MAGGTTVVPEVADRKLPPYAITNFARGTCREAFERFDFFNHFKGIFISGDGGLSKPDPRIFQLWSARYGIDLTDCVFIDDVPANCYGARTRSIRATDLVSPDQSRTQLGELGFL